MKIQPPTGNSEWGSILLSFGERERSFSYHAPSGEVFNDDPDPLIRVKCLALIPLTPFICLMRSVAWSAQAGFLWLSESFDSLNGDPISQEMETNRITAYEDSGRALSYGCYLTAYACAGVVYPYWARQKYGALERELNRQPDGPHRSKYYLAFCFQRLFIMPKDPQQQQHIVEERLIGYLNKVKALRNAQYSCDWARLLLAINDLQQPRSP